MPSDRPITLPFAPAAAAFQLAGTALSSGADMYKTARTHPDPASNASRNTAIGLFNSNESTTIVNPEDGLAGTLVKGVAISAGLAAGVAGATLVASKLAERERGEEGPRRNVTVTGGTGTRRRNAAKERERERQRERQRQREREVEVEVEEVEE